MMDQFDRTAGLHLDALARFLRFATDRPLSPPASALAEALGKTLLHSDIRVCWRIYKDRRILEESSSYWSCSGRKVGESQKAEDSTWTPSRPTATHMFAQLHSDHFRGIRISKGGPVDGARTELELVFTRTGGSFPSEKIEGFRRDIVGVTMLFQAFSSLAAARLAPPQRTQRDDFGVRLDEASADLDRFRAFTNTVALQEQVVEGVLLEMFGLGWDVHSVFEEEGRRALLSFERCFESTETPRLLALQSVLAATRGVRPRATRQSKGASTQNLHVLNLIARWTYLHAQAREALRGGLLQSGGRESEYRLKLKQYGAELAGMPLMRLPMAKVPMGIFSCWLRLWFCLSLLETLDQDGNPLSVLAENDRWRLYADVAYVVRESLRGFFYRGHSDLEFHLASLSSALCGLVERHAVNVLRLPHKLNLGGLLEEIGRISIGMRGLGTSHLQHVLEMYIGGQFFLDMRISEVGGANLDKKFEGATVCEMLAVGGEWNAGSVRQKELRKAFALAALLHDIGVLLFPWWPRRAQGLASVQNEVQKGFYNVRKVLNESVQGLLEVCRVELIENGVFDPIAHKGVSSWIENCSERGEADHSVLGAWYLMHIGKDVAGLDSATLAQASRAVLLHAVPAETVRSADDPVAALLVLCDELFNWHQDGYELPLSQSNRMRLAVERFAEEPRARDSIFETFHVPGLRIEFDKSSKRLSTSLSLAENTAHQRVGKVRTWPLVAVELKNPNRLPASVHEYWLLSSQNLGRIVPSKTTWGPVLCVGSQSHLRQPPLSTLELLGRVSRRAGLSLRPCLERWLDHYGTEVEVLPDSDSQIATFGPAPSFCEFSLPHLFQELDQHAEAVLHEEELRRQARTGRFPHRK